jgi:6-pyruvoyltetrahydropterin/6-carboxytetrahydropterin synthase
VRTELSKTFTLESAHRLPNVPPDHKCARLHGHSFEVTLHVRGPVDPALGWIVDFAEITKAFAPMHELLDHRYLNEVQGLDNPTSENLAKFILERVRVPGATLSAVTVSETCTSSCTVYADGD